ncbi:hypothetical protein KIV56_18105 [Cryobacterium breve]|uniref:FAD-binding oxidoreductase/transferase type 4 C-terminal domain-containing protein n=1 Tax=Cryobacterium breve TaxID=1259258 RepID=A0ABY7NBY8_9MICO|nr:FAD-linked oxidase C-terminal domain-containing protein [Cryobacterium breve]WBM80025.1 hypothetical protein KIV56_18105 [Cryobacterium breve]
MRQALLLVQSDAAGQADDDVAEYARILEAGGAGEIVIASDPAHLDQLMSARRLLQPALQAARGASLNEDVTVPRSQLQALLTGLQEISSELLIPISTGGHLGDGNLHPVIGFNPDLPAEVDAAHRAFKRVIQLAVTLGGSASGEHGIGLLKQAHLDDELGLAVREPAAPRQARVRPRQPAEPGKKALAARFENSQDRHFQQWISGVWLC